MILHTGCISMIMVTANDAGKIMKYPPSIDYPSNLQYVTGAVGCFQGALETGTWDILGDILGHPGTTRHLLAAEDHEEVRCDEVQGPGHSVMVASLVAHAYAWVIP